MRRSPEPACRSEPPAAPFLSLSTGLLLARRTTGVLNVMRSHSERGGRRRFFSRHVYPKARSRSRSCSSASLRTRSLSGCVCSSMLSRTSERRIAGDPASSSTEPVPCSLANALVALKAARRHTDLPAATSCCPWPGFRSSYVRLPGATLRGQGRARCGAWPRRRSRPRCAVRSGSCVVLVATPLRGAGRRRSVPRSRPRRRRSGR